MYITPVINQIPLVSGNANIDNNCFMENREQEILSEIKSMMASIRSQLEMLDAKLVELHQEVDPRGFESDLINVIVDDIGILGVREPVVEEIPLDLPEALEAEAADVTEETALTEIAEVTEVPTDIPEVSEVTEAPVEVTGEEADEAVAEETVQAVEQLTEEDDDLPLGEMPVEIPVEVPVEIPAEPVQVEPEDDDLPGIFDEPEPVTVAAKAAVAARPTLNDSLAADQAWRRDMPGTSVRDIRSAISLNDRVIFINQLFEEDAQAFVNALSDINQMTTLDEVVEYLAARYPQWNMNSDLVYRFMMAVRRKIS